MIKNQILPEIEIIEKYQETQKQRKSYGYSLKSNNRLNNRKSNRCRKIQVVKFLTKSWPPVFLTRELKSFK